MPCVTILTEPPERTIIHAEAHVFTAGAMHLVDATREALHDTPDETPLYSMLTPHHRLELVADVVGWRKLYSF